MPRTSSTSDHQSIARTAISNTTSAIVDFVLPPTCAFCKSDLPHNPASSDSIPLCHQCRTSFISDDRAACIMCGMPVGPYVNTTGGCPNCVRRNFRFDEVIRLGIYEDSLRTACIRGKSRGAEALASALADLLWDEQQERLRDFSPDVIVPVPQFWLHWFTRPHHQALTMAETLADRMAVPCAERAICKTRHTIDQSSLPRAKRLTNLAHAFEVRRGSISKGQRVLIVDDILTTGTTSHEIARVIRRSGASSVAVAVIAIVP